MPFEFSRRAVTIGLGGVALVPGAALGLPAHDAAQAWRAACLATERAWLDEMAALDRIVERGAEAVHERYFATAIAHYEDNLAWCRSRAHVMRTEPPCSMRVSGFITAFDHSAERAAINLHGFTAQRALWRRLATEEGLAALSARVEAAEAAEDAVSASMLDPANGERAPSDRTTAVASPAAGAGRADMNRPRDGLGRSSSSLTHVILAADAALRGEARGAAPLSPKRNRRGQGSLRCARTTRNDSACPLPAPVSPTGRGAAAGVLPHLNPNEGDPYDHR